MSKPFYDGDIYRRNMPKKRDKASIALYGSSYETALPTINVKVRGSLFDVIERVQKEFRCSEEVAERAVERAFEMECETFWAYWTNQYPYNTNPENGPGYYFPDHDVSVESDGRMGGHLVVRGLPPVESWDAILVMRWWRFVDAVCQDAEYRILPDTLIADIETNDWAGTRLLAELTEVA